MTEPNSPAPIEPQNNGGNTGFTPPGSQDELNRIIGERVSRERAKFADYDDVKSAAARVPELEQKVADAEAEQAKVPATVAEQLRAHLVALHQIPQDDADLFLTATDPEILLRQVSGLVGRNKTAGNRVPNEGRHIPPPPADERRAFADFLTGNRGS